MRKITPPSHDPLVRLDAADVQRKTRQSVLISQLPESPQRRERDELAREGYAFYSQESSEFAEASAAAVAEAIEDEGPSW